MSFMLIGRQLPSIVTNVDMVYKIHLNEVYVVHEQLSCHQFNTDIKIRAGVATQVRKVVAHIEYYSSPVCYI